jgi:putative hydrolase of the HAD superfamily
MRLEALFLDAGGVMLAPNWVRVADALGRHGIRVDPDRLAAAELPAKRQLDDDGVTRATTDASRGWLYFDLVLEQAGINRSTATGAALAELDEYHARHNLWETVLPGVVEALGAFRAMGLRLVVVSNANGTLHGHLERLGLGRAFDLTLDSQVEGVEKPDPRFFALALERSHASPETTVHVGDLYHIDIVGARAAGLRAVLVDAAGLYPDADCRRVSSLAELVPAIRAGEFGTAGRKA